MRVVMLVAAVAMAVAGCARTGAPPSPVVGKPPIPPELLAAKRAGPAAPVSTLKPVRVIRMPNGTLVEEMRP